MQMGGVFLVVIFAALIIAGIVSGRKKKEPRQSIRYLERQGDSPRPSPAQKAHREVHGALFISIYHHPCPPQRRLFALPQRLPRSRRQAQERLTVSEEVVEEIIGIHGPCVSRSLLLGLCLRCSLLFGRHCPQVISRVIVSPWR